MSAKNCIELDSVREFFATEKQQYNADVLSKNAMITEYASTIVDLRDKLEVGQFESSDIQIRDLTDEISSMHYEAK
jgi:hypothetical protein